MGYVYAIGTMDGNNPVKIGVTGSLKGRLLQLQTGSPVKLFILAAWHFAGMGDAERTETVAHMYFSMRNSHGEWFFVSVEEIDEFMRRDTALDISYFGIKGGSGTRVSSALATPSTPLGVIEPPHYISHGIIIERISKISPQLADRILSMK